MQRETNNSLLQDKIELRLNHLPDKKELLVLDCYAGAGLVWGAIKQQRQGITVVGIDKVKQDRFTIVADNLKVLRGIDLSPYDVVDLDDYGIPVNAFEILLDRGYKGTVFLTWITARFGRQPHKLLETVGVTKEMREKTITLVSKNPNRLMMEYLTLKGVKEAWYRTNGRKTYIALKLT